MHVFTGVSRSCHSTTVNVVSTPGAEHWIMGYLYWKLKGEKWT